MTTFLFALLFSLTARADNELKLAGVDRNGQACNVKIEVDDENITSIHFTGSKAVTLGPKDFHDTGAIQYGDVDPEKNVRVYGYGSQRTLHFWYRADTKTVILLDSVSKYGFAGLKSSSIEIRCVNVEAEVLTANKPSFIGDAK